MKKIFVLLLLLAGCTTPQNPEQWMEAEINACLPTAIAFRQGLQRQGVWAEVFRYNFKDSNGKQRGHAMTAYLYPSGKNQLYTYDSWGSYRTRAYTNNVELLAREAHRLRHLSTNTFLAEWIR